MWHHRGELAAVRPCRYALGPVPSWGTATALGESSVRLLGEDRLAHTHGCGGLLRTDGREASMRAEDRSRWE
jgi:hypothetical protein